MSSRQETERDFIRRVTRVRPVPLVPEIALHLADDVLALWAATEVRAGRAGLDPPFWGFAWAGGIGLARHLLDHPELVRGRRVLDLGTGCGIVAVAAALAGAAEVTANDVEPLALAAAGLNAEVNAVRLGALPGDLTAGPPPATVEVLLAADVCYEAAMAAAVLQFLHRAAGQAVLALLADPGRRYLHRSGLTARQEYGVPVPVDLEGRSHRDVVIWSVNGPQG